jgi:branched-chain amino acid transport system permease protein
LIVLIGIIIAGIIPALNHGSYIPLLGEFVVYFMWITLAESWNMVGGYAGLLNLGLVAFFALGAVVCALAFQAGLSIIPAMIVAGIAGALLGLALIPTFRLRSDYFAIATLVIPVIAKPLVEFFTNRVSFSVPVSQILPRVDFWYLGLGMTAVSIFGTYFIMKTRVGIALRALGDDETASASLGVSTLFYKTVALVLSGFIAAVAGAFYLQFIGSVSTTLFQDLTFSLYPIFMVIIGGSGTFEGPIVGGLVFSVIEYYSPTLFVNSTADVLVFSVVIMAVAVLLPRGIVPSVRKIVGRIRKREKERNIVRSLAPVSSAST